MDHHGSLSNSFCMQWKAVSRVAENSTEGLYHKRLLLALLRYPLLSRWGTSGRLLAINGYLDTAPVLSLVSQQFSFIPAFLSFISHSLSLCQSRKTINWRRGTLQEEKFKSFLAPELEPEFFSTEGAGAGANDNAAAQTGSSCQ